ncbi:hypothetical protein SNEBB_000066 [Seison nebaliae]|nr:hypothetical protein SNEBB_000066 [Seison nebaliae]
MFTQNVGKLEETQIATRRFLDVLPDFITGSPHIQIEPSCGVIELHDQYVDRRVENNYRIKKSLGFGKQGVAYLVENVIDKKIYVNKLSKQADVALIESNALYAFEHHPIGLNHDYKRINLIKGTDVKTKPMFAFDALRRIGFIGEKRSHCLLTSFVDGNRLRTSPEITVQTRHNPFYKNILMFLIFMLRQLQAVHFTLNRDAIFIENSVLLGPQSYANAHADLHFNNILMKRHVKDNGFEIKLPILIDYGYGASLFYGAPDDVAVEFYNKRQRDEVDIREENRIHRNRILNFWQNIDFCESVVIIARLFLDLRGGKPHFSICEGVRKKIIKIHANADGDFIRHTTLFALPELQDTDLIYIIRALLLGVNLFTTYQHWLYLYEVLNPNYEDVVWKSSANGNRNLASNIPLSRRRVIVPIMHVPLNPFVYHHPAGLVPINMRSWSPVDNVGELFTASFSDSVSSIAFIKISLCIDISIDRVYLNGYDWDAEDIDKKLLDQSIENIDKKLRLRTTVLDTNTDDFVANEQCSIDLYAMKLKNPNISTALKYDIERKLGEGCQGSVYLVKDNGEEYVDKLTTMADDVLIEYNAMKSFDLHPIGLVHNYRVKGMSAIPQMPRPEIIPMAYLNRVKIKQHLKSYCLRSTLVEGEVSIDSVLFGPNPPRHTLRQFLSFVIFLLRQLQAAHFSLNEKKIFKGTPYLQENSYTNAHGDIHAFNIMLVDYPLDNHGIIRLPILIDWGALSQRYYQGLMDVVVEVYNKKNRDEKNIVIPNVIATNRMLTFWQNADFCETAVAISELFAYRERRRAPLQLCAELRRRAAEKHQKDERQMLRHIPLIENLENAPLLRTIVQLLLHCVNMFSTYHKWLLVYNFFAQEDEQVVTARATPSRQRKISVGPSPLLHISHRNTTTTTTTKDALPVVPVVGKPSRFVHRKTSPSADTPNLLPRLTPLKQPPIGYSPPGGSRVPFRSSNVPSAKKDENVPLIISSKPTNDVIRPKFERNPFPILAPFNPSKTEYQERVNLRENNYKSKLPHQSYMMPKDWQPGEGHGSRKSPILSPIRQLDIKPKVETKQLEEKVSKLKIEDKPKLAHHSYMMPEDWQPGST